MSLINLRFDERAPVLDTLTRARPPLLLPAGEISGDAPPPTSVTGTVVLVAPVGTVSPASRPGFVVAVDTAPAGTRVEVQWDTDAGFPHPGGASVAAPAGQVDAYVTVQAQTDLADGVWTWRARLTGTHGAGPWTTPATLAVNSAEGQAALGGSWTVDAVTGPATHLWFIDHTVTGTDSGATGRLVGTGFGTAPQVLLGDLPCTVTSVTAVAASPYPPARIDPDEGVCTPWHQVIAFVIPGVDPDHDGDALTVIGGS